MINKVSIKLFGIFKKAYGDNSTSIKFKNMVDIKEIINKISHISPELKNVLIDSELNNPLPNAIILVNGKEINVLNGLNTCIRNGPTGKDRRISVGSFRT